MIAKIRQSLEIFSKQQRLFLLAAMACSFFISFDYAIVRPVSNSLFIASFGAKYLPYVWICSVPLNFLIVSLYNRFVSKTSCYRLFLIVASTVTLVNVAAAMFIDRHQSLSFLFYAWKDIYVMLMFQLLWSVIHSTIDTKGAKYLYGFLFAVGASGGFAGSLLAGTFAVALGSETLLYFTLPIYLLLSFAYHNLIRYSAVGEKAVTNQVCKDSSMKESFKLIAGSKLLLAILLMVVFMQVTATLTDFQMNSFLESYLPQKDLRTAYLGKLLSMGNIITMLLQLVGVYTLIRVFGKYKTHLLVPLILCINSLTFSFFPTFALISYGFITIKAFDFSLFNVIKEMLYIPLKVEEKFRAKALIDVFIYRGAKVFASLFVLGLQAFFASHLLPVVSWLTTAIFILWMFVVFSIKDCYEQSAQEQVLRSER